MRVSSWLFAWGLTAFRAKLFASIHCRVAVQLRARWPPLHAAATAFTSGSVYATTSSRGPAPPSHLHSYNANYSSLRRAQTAVSARQPRCFLLHRRHEDPSACQGLRE